VFLYCADQMICILFPCVLDSEVIDHESKTYRSRCMCPESWNDFTLWVQYSANHS
jgi:hypothetical protein